MKIGSMTISSGLVFLLIVTQPAFAETGGAISGGTVRETNLQGWSLFHENDQPVDKVLLKGWQVFQEVKCGLCHGDSGDGGPGGSLLQRLKSISKEQFSESVLRGKGLMPHFGENPSVVNNIEELYRYLKARSDEDLLEGHPGR